MATFKQFKAQDIIISPLEVNKGLRFVANTPTPTSSPTPSVTPTISATPSISITPSITVTPSISVTPSITVSKSISATPSVTRTPSVTPSISLSGPPNQSPTATPSISITPSRSISATPSRTPTRSITPSVSSNLFSYNTYGYSTVSNQAACVNYAVGGNPTVFTDVAWNASSNPVIYGTSSGTKRAVVGYYTDPAGSGVGYYGSSGTWQPTTLCLV